MDNINRNFLNKFKELFDLYITVKSYILLSEEVTGKLVVASVNELRAVLDHLFKSFYFTNEVLDADKQDAEIHKAFRHLKRAGYDALEVIALYKLPEIKSILNNYLVNTIITGYPDYYTKDRKSLSEIEKQLAKDRDGIEGETFFDDFKVLIAKLLEIDHRISYLMPNDICKKLHFSPLPRLYLCHMVKKRNLSHFNCLYAIQSSGHFALFYCSFSSFNSTRPVFNILSV